MFKNNKMFEESNNGINKINGVMSADTSRYAGPVSWNMGDGVIGSYDNLQLKTQCGMGNFGPPCNPPVKSSKQVFFSGSPLPLKSESIYMDLPKDSMNIFAKTYFSPECCESGGAMYSSDRGCACLTQNQITGLSQMRGNNQSYYNYGF